MRIKNWAQFQHFKDRKPPWIKLYRGILDDMQWHELEPKAAKVLTMLWLIASEDDGNLPDIKTLAFRLRMTESEINGCCSKLGHWLEQVDIAPISDRYQDDPLETETETETELEANASVGRADPLPKCDTQSVVDLYHEVLPELPGVRLMNDSRRKAISSLWKFALTSRKSDGERRATTGPEALEWIRGYFTRARDNDFLMGRGHKAAGHEGWQCDLDFLLTEKGKKHVIEKTVAA